MWLRLRQAGAADSIGADGGGVTDGAAGHEAPATSFVVLDLQSFAYEHAALLDQRGERIAPATAQHTTAGIGGSRRGTSPPRA